MSIHWCEISTTVALHYIQLHSIHVTYVALHCATVGDLVAVVCWCRWL